MLAPIAVFAFNRPDLLRQTLDALAGNALAKHSSVTIFCDGPRHEQEEPATRAVRAVARHAQGFAALEVVERPHNLGCAASIIDGLMCMFTKHERLIVIEDDILCSPYTLSFLNEGLERYQDSPTVWNIAAWSPPPAIFIVPEGYPYDVYAVPRFNCWGWASWRDRVLSVDWHAADFSAFAGNPWLHRAFNAGGADLTPLLFGQMGGKLNTWDILMDYARFRQGRIGINPVRAYTHNLGMGCGTHTTRRTGRFDTNIAAALPPSSDFRWLEHIFVDQDILSAYSEALCPAHHAGDTQHPAQARLQGIRAARRAIVEKMARLNIPPERICLLTGLDQEEVRLMLIELRREGRQH